MPMTLPRLSFVFMEAMASDEREVISEMEENLASF